MLEKPPAGYRKVSWAQLLEADKALWRYVQGRCPDGTKCKPGERTTEFQKHWLTGMYDQDVRLHLGVTNRLEAEAGAGEAVAKVTIHPGWNTTARLRRDT